MDLHNYTMRDWIGDVDYRPLTSKKQRERARVLASFMERKPVSIQELAKLAPHITLDYSRESLVQLDHFIETELEQAIKGDPNSFFERPNLAVGASSPCPQKSPFNTLPPVWRSICSDAFVYVAETTIRAISEEMPKEIEGLEWTVFDGKSDGESWGFPGLRKRGNKRPYHELMMGCFLEAVTRFCIKRQPGISIHEYGEPRPIQPNLEWIFRMSLYYSREDGKQQGK